MNAQKSRPASIEMSCSEEAGELQQNESRDICPPRLFEVNELSNIELTVAL